MLTGLRDCDFGSWSGLTLDEVGARDPVALADWLADPQARPHGGETLAELVGRVGRWSTSSRGRTAGRWPWCRPWWPGRPWCTPWACRAEAIFRVDVAPLGRVTVSRAADGWRLQGLSRS